MPYSSDQFNVTVEQAIASSFVKYTRLQDIVYDTFSQTSIASATELNIFIDLYSVLKSIFSEHYRTIVTDYTAITSSVINMCGHYRNFFNKLSVRTKFFIIFSFNTCDINRKFVAGYNDSFYNKSSIKEFRELAMNNFELMDILIPYLPDIFFVKSIRNYESSVIISHVIDMLNDGKPNLIISRDLYPIQLCSLHKYTSLLRPNKSSYGDNSIMVPINEKFNYRIQFWNLIAHIRNINPEKLYEISPLNFPLFSAINKFPERNMDQIDRADNAVNLIKSLVGSEDIKILPQQLYSSQQLANNIQIAKIESRVKTLDVDFMKPYYIADPESKSIRFDNLRDDSTVRHIISKFFVNNPIDLSKL